MSRLSLIILFPLIACIHAPTPEEQIAQLSRTTGLERVQPPGTEGYYLGKVHRGYPVIFRPSMGNVWGRYAARVAMGEIGRELGGIWSYLTGVHEYVGTPVGSTLDRLLSRAIGEPLSIVFILEHGKKNFPRADIVSDYSTIKPAERLPEFYEIGFVAGTLYCADRRFGEQLKSNSELIARLENLRSHYIRADERAVTFIFAGNEIEYSNMIQSAGGYERLLSQIMDSLADIADAG